jgi:hypothetical protein
MRPNIGPSASRRLRGHDRHYITMIMMYWVGPMMGLMKMDIAASLGRMLGIGWTGGITLHFINGTVIFPVIYAFFLYRILSGTPVIRGAIWGVILWFVAQLIVMRMMGGGVFSAKMGMMMAIGSLIEHFIYGAVLGAIGGGAEMPAAVWTPSARAA